MGKKADVRKKGSRYDKAEIEEMKKAEKPGEKESKAEDEKEPAEIETKPKSKGRFHLMFEA